jgi:hypothetical protein
VFDPDSLRLPVEGLRDRYDAVTWAEFEASSRATKLDDGRTVWAWLNGAEAPGPLPEEPPPVGSAGTALGTPLAGKLVTSGLRKAEVARVARVLGAIDRVHGDGPLAAIPVDTAPDGGSSGVFRFTTSGVPQSIGYRPRKGPWPELTLVHEVGHWLDLAGLDTPGTFATQRAKGALAEFLTLARETEAVRSIASSGLKAAQVRYYLRGDELFARAYAQFIAEESRDPTLLAQVAKTRESILPGRAWTTEEFAPLREKLREVFVSAGWLQPKPDSP